MSSPDDWRWVWLVAAIAFTLGEMAAAGSFFLLPFGIGAAAAAVAAFAGVGVPAEWVIFVAVSGGSLAGLRVVSRRIDRPGPLEGVGARRLIGQVATVTEEVPPAPSTGGLVRIGGEEWRAESSDGDAIGAGTVVKVVEVRGTRVVVWPMGSPSPRTPLPEQEES